MGGGGESEGMISKIGPVGVKRKRIDEVMEGGGWCAGGADVQWGVMPQPLWSNKVRREMEGYGVIDLGIGLVQWVRARS